MSSEPEIIKERLDIAEIVGEYVALKPAGKNLKGLCPFHSEKTPSFSVSPARGTWYCFGACGEGGDMFSFIQKIEGIDFPAALKMLAERAGVELSRGSRESTSGRQRLFDLLTASSRLYHEILMRQGAGKKARKYLEERGVRRQTMEQFNIGYAPPSWDVLQHWLEKQGFTIDEMVGAGVVGRSNSNKIYDRFRGRIMFPIADTQGRVVAFGGRITPWHETGNEGKYVNSPETALYEKRRVVYNLDRAKQVLRKNQPCVVVEGYMDVVMLVQAGMENVVATSGTAFTAEHVSQLGRFTSTLHFAFDADAAGWKATVSATEAALEKGMTVATVVLPPGTDPADMAQKEPDLLKKTFTSTRPLLSVLLEQLKAAPDASSREKQLDAMVSLVRRVQNPIQQGAMVQEAADILHVPEARILAMLSDSRPAPLAERDSPAGEFDDPPARHGAEHQLLGLIIDAPAVRQDIFPYLEESFFLDPACHTLYNNLQRLAESDSSFLSMTADIIMQALEAGDVPFAEGVRAQAEELMSTSANTAEREGRLLLRSLQQRSVRSRLAAVQQELTGSGKAQRTRALQEFQKLAQQLMSIDNS